jgi:hypothetical protein
MGTLISWLQTSRVAATMGQSQMLTAVVSGVHLLGLTLVVGGALVSGLRLVGWIFPDRPVADVASGAVRGIGVGLTVSVITGLLLVAPRAAAAAENTFFQLKMLLLVAAAALHVGVYRRVMRRNESPRGPLKFAGALNVILWFGVAVAGCAFILFE